MHQIILRRVKQECILSPLYSENISGETLDNCTLGIQVNGVHIMLLIWRYSNDIQELHIIIDQGNSVNKTYGLNIYSKKNKFMIIRRNNIRYESANITVDGNNLERVRQYKYLESCLHEIWDPDKEIKYLRITAYPRLLIDLWLHLTDFKFYLLIPLQILDYFYAFIVYVFQYLD